MNQITDTVKHLIIINVLFFAATKFAFPQLQELFALHFPKNPNFGIWQYITSMFMHSQRDIMHLAFNMLGLWMFGSPLEQMWGRNKFLFFYFSAGIGAGLIYTLVNYFQFNMAFDSLINLGITSDEFYKILALDSPNSTSFVNEANAILRNNQNIVISEDFSENIFSAYGHFNTPAVGASGALYGVLAAFGMQFPDSKLALIFFPVPIAAKYFIPVMIGIDLFSGLTGFSIFGNGNIAHFAHVGGALVGFLIVLYWKKNQFKRWDK